MRPLVSVLMAVRNGRPTLGAALRSLQAQTYPHWELTLVDDGSTDGSAEVALTLRDPRVRVHRDGEGRGLAARLNEAVARAPGQYLARADADDLLYPERFAQQVAWLEAHPGVDLLGSAMLVFRSGGTVRGLLRGGQEHAALCAHPGRGFALPHPTWMGRAAWFRRFPYDAGNRRSEDQDLLLRAHTRSVFASLPQVLVAYRYDHLSLAKSRAGRRDYLHALLREARASGRWGPLLAGAPLHGAKLAVEGLASALGAGEWLLQRRFAPAPPEEQARWAALLAACGPDTTGS